MLKSSLGLPTRNVPDPDHRIPGWLLPQLAERFMVTFERVGLELEERDAHSQGHVFIWSQGAIHTLSHHQARPL